MSGWDSFRNAVQWTLGDLESRQQTRTLDSQFYSPAQINLCKNDYLGFSARTDFCTRLYEKARGLPPGATSSRLLGGEHPLFQKLEDAFAFFKQCESALFFPSGYAANESLAQVLIAVANEAEVFSDELNHASIIDGIRLSRISQERKHIFAHNNLQELESKLIRSASPYKFIFTESLFSMDGDLADLAAMQKLAKDYDAIMIVDEAHSLGVLGEEGRGAIDHAGLNHSQLISVNTCGKALGVQGAFVCGPKWLKDLMINKARTFIFTTAPSPWIAAAVLESLEFVKKAQPERSRLNEVSSALRSQLHTLGYNTGFSHSHIIPIILGAEAKTLQASQVLLEQGILTKAIRPPTVAANQSRLRLSLHAGLTDTDLDRIVAAFERMKA